MTYQIVHGSVELVYLPITNFGATITTGISYSIVPTGSTYGTFTTATVTASGTAALLDGTLAVGSYDCYAKIVATPETAIKLCGQIQIV